MNSGGQLDDAITVVKLIQRTYWFLFNLFVFAFILFFYFCFVFSYKIDTLCSLKSFRINYMSTQNRIIKDRFKCTRERKIL